MLFFIKGFFFVSKPDTILIEVKYHLVLVKYWLKVKKKNKKEYSAIIKFHQCTEIFSLWINIFKTTKTFYKVENNLF